MNRPSPVGRAVRLHFRCHAELPIGSFLRVTGSTLWAPGTSASDPTDASGAVTRTESAAFPVLDHTTMNGGGSLSASSMYTSSVEMVTTPEEYPIWRTRNPVVVVIHHEKKTIQHHYYRYLVVSPGGSNFLDVGMDDDEEAISTSNEVVGSTPVVQWENPFDSFVDRARRAEASSVSLPSVSALPTRTDYRSLPYRVVDIHVQTGQADSDEGGSPRLDHWNVADDATFRSYRIREAVRTTGASTRSNVVVDFPDCHRTDPRFDFHLLY